MERFADELDFTQVNIELMTEAAVSEIRRRVSQGKGRQECLDCGTKIPTERLVLVTNAQRCATCQEHHERNVALFRRS